MDFRDGTRNVLTTEFVLIEPNYSLEGLIIVGVGIWSNGP